MALFPVRTNSRWRPAAILEYSNGHISATGDPIHFMFGSRACFIVGRSNDAISGSIKSMMAAGRHLEKLHWHCAVSPRQHSLLV